MPEICRQLGYRGRRGARGATPTRTISERFLSEEERGTVADMLAAGQSRLRIAAALGRAPSTVSREVRRSDGAGKHRTMAGVQAGRPRSRRIPAGTSGGASTMNVAAS